MVSSTPLVIIDNYDSFTFNLYQMVQAQTEREVKVFRNDAITLEALLALAPAGIILSPGPGHPANDRDFGLCKQIILHWAGLAKETVPCPVLGVCLGHQGMAQHLGGQVTQAPQIVHGKTSQMSIVKASPLFNQLSNPFQAMRYHSLVADEASLPDCFEITAKAVAENLIMAMQHKTIPLYGVQFHPESIGTPEGGTLLKNFIGLCDAFITH
jgi:anthranilate synthase component II